MPRRLTSALDEPRRFPSRQIAVVAVVVALVAGGGIAWQALRPGSDPSRTTTTGQVPLSTARQTDGDDQPTGQQWQGETRNVDVYMDGWSMATLGTASLIARSGTAGTATPVTFAPVGAAETLKERPDVVRQALSRMASGDADLSCNESGCQGSRAVEPAWLDDPSSIPGLGESYAGLGISHGLWKATVQMPRDSLYLSLEGDEWASRPVSLRQPLPAGSGQGSVDDVPMLAGAWGVLFPADAAWAGTDAARYRRPALPGLYTGGVADPWTSLQLADGLGATGSSQVVDQLTDSQLTYFSSPVTGCGVVPTCYPGVVNAEVTDVQRTSIDVCDDYTGAGSIVLVSATVKANLPAPVHVNGAWQGVSPEQFPDQAGSSVLGYSGNPPLVGPGTVTWRQAAMVLLDWEGQTVELAGARNDVGAPALSSIDTGVAFGGEYQPCEWRP